MNTEQLRKNLNEIHSTRGRLKTLCIDAGVDYKKVWKFTTGAIQKIDLDTAGKLIPKFQTADDEHH